MGELKERMKADLELRCYSKSTQDEYLRYAERFAGHFMKYPAEMGKAQVWEYLLHVKRIEALVCHPSAGDRYGYSDDSGAARTQLDPHNRTVHQGEQNPCGASKETPGSARDRGRRAPRVASRDMSRRCPGGEDRR